MPRLPILAVCLALFACDSAEETVGETGETASIDPLEGPFEVAVDHAARVVFVPSESAGEKGIAIRVTSPEGIPGRYTDGGLPVVLEVPGGTGTNGFGQPGGVVPLVYPGFVHIEVILPGGGTAPWSSGGEPDARGPNAQLAIADVIGFARGLSQLADGRTIADVVGAPVDSENVGMIGLSNGGNLGLLAAARHDTGLCWAAMWETPIDDTFVTVDIGARMADTGPQVDADGNGVPWDDMVNPGYVEGACDTEGCTFDMGPVRWNGDTFFRDGNGDGRLGNEDGENDVNADGQLTDDEDYPYGAVVSADGVWVYSRAVTRGAAEGMVNWPSRVATVEVSEAFWSDRVALRAFPELPRDLPLMVLGTSRDHVQAAATHPHVGVAYEAALESLDWVRLNPDEAYIRAASGVTQSPVPDTQAGAALPELPRGLVPHQPRILSNAIFLAGVAEMADRCRLDRWDPNLDAVLAPVSICPNCEKPEAD